MRFILPLIALLTFTAEIYGSQYSFEKITTSDGLSQNDVISIFQDSRGYLWFGTHDGLNRYDGYEFKIFRPSDTDSNSICSNIIKNIVEDNNNNLWISTQDNGVSVYNMVTETFVTINNDSKNKNRIAHNSIHQVFIDSKNRVWLSTRSGVSCIQNTNNNYKITNINNYSEVSYPSEIWNTNGITELSNGEIVFFSMHGAFKIDMNLEGEPNGKISDFISSIKDLNVKALIEYKEGFLLGHGDGLSWLVKDTTKIDEYIRHDIYDITANILTQAPNGDIWFGGFSELTKIKYLQAEDIPFKIERKFAKGKEEHNLSSGFIRCIYFDNTGIMWIGTTGGGINKHDPRKQQFRKYQHTAQKGSISSNNISNMLETCNGTLFIGTTGKGLNILTPSNNKNYSTGFMQLDVTSPYEQNAIRSLHEVTCNHKSEILVGSGYYSLFAKAVKSGHAWKIENVESPITERVFAIEIDEYGAIWLGIYGEGLFRATKKNGSYTYKNFNTNNSNISSDIVRSITEDTQGRLWIGTDNGLLVIDRKQKQKNTPIFSIYKKEEDNLNSISHNYILPITEDKKGRIWVGTLGGGINLYQEGDFYYSGSFKRITTEHGIANNVIKQILEDKNGIIWISSNNGLTRLNPEDFSIRNYGKEDGLQDSEFGEFSGIVLNDGEILFGGIHGFNAFYPNEIIEDTLPPVVVFNRLEIFDYEIGVNRTYDNRIILNRALNYTNEITLTHNENNFTMHFSAIHYSVPKSNQFKYKLVGFDKDWITASSDRRFAKYTNLKSGRYTFFVTASNADGTWTKEPRSLVIRIKPPFWKTVWFRLTIILILILIIYSRFRTINNRKAELENVVKLRTSELRLKNTMLEEQAEALNETNMLLQERQELVQKQTQELELQKEWLEKLNATKDKFYSILAHDLINPFNNLLGFLELLKRNYKNYDDISRKKKIDTIYSSAKLLFSFMNDLLEWTRVQRGAIPFSPAPVNLIELIEHELLIYKNMAIAKGIFLELKCIYQELSIEADENMLRTILRNLLTNAIKFTKREGQISVDISKTSQYARFSVTDTGIGIPDNVLHNLFEIDRDYSATGTAKEKGTGLGLVLCKEFVEIHNGKIWAESKLGQGSTFSFTLPLSQKNNRYKNKTDL